MAYCRAGLDAYRTGRSMAVHFQQPGDPISYAPAADGLCRLPAVTALQTGQPPRSTDPPNCRDPPKYSLLNCRATGAS
ncbi:hypothetical protein CGZ69_35310 [Streptomyces peucetius subsp. caesius ATCC 27952]|nr:hypothetical protein CGZ69_35310 [Streptomyces peucetius subsp. caesius ATCC 27952]